MLRDGNFGNEGFRVGQLQATLQATRSVAGEVPYAIYESCSKILH